MQPYTVPLTTVTASASPHDQTGLIDVIISYSTLNSSVEDKTTERSMVTLSVGILRACGLKDATMLAAREGEPSLVSHPAQVGVNAFVKMKLSPVKVSIIQFIYCISIVGMTFSFTVFIVFSSEFISN